LVGEHCLPGFRESSVINVNPGVRLPRQRFCSRADWLAFCAEAALGLRQPSVERLRNAPLDMSQYYGLCWAPAPSGPACPGAQSYGMVRRPAQRLHGGRLRNQFVNRGLSAAGSDPRMTQARPVTLSKATPRRRFLHPQTVASACCPSMHRDALGGTPRRSLVAAHRTRRASLQCARLERSAFLLCLDRPLLAGPGVASGPPGLSGTAKMCGEHAARMGASGSAIVPIDSLIRLCTAIRIFDNRASNRLASGPPVTIDLPDGLAPTSIPCQLFGLQAYASFNKDLAEPTPRAAVALQLATTSGCTSSICATYESGSASQDESHAAAQAFRVACQAHSLLTAQAVAGQGHRSSLWACASSPRSTACAASAVRLGAFRRASAASSSAPAKVAVADAAHHEFRAGGADGYDQLDEQIPVSLTAYSDRRGTDSDRLGGQPEGDSLGWIFRLMLLRQRQALP
uniref:5'-nucleotidase n=1 Tax=Macrostomum lignano TaxID=282301 RepID=A0A1I8FDY2_9PLAT